MYILDGWRCCGAPARRRSVLWQMLISPALPAGLLFACPIVRWMEVHVRDWRRRLTCSCILINCCLFCRCCLWVEAFEPVPLYPVVPAHLDQHVCRQTEHYLAVPLLALLQGAMPLISGNSLSSCCCFFYRVNFWCHFPLNSNFLFLILLLFDHPSHSGTAKFKQPCPFFLSSFHSLLYTAPSVKWWSPNWQRQIVQWLLFDIACSARSAGLQWYGALSAAQTHREFLAIHFPVVVAFSTASTFLCSFFVFFSCCLS